jgi:hypothetical protein
MSAEKELAPGWVLRLDCGKLFREAVANRDRETQWKTKQTQKSTSEI